MEPKFLPTFSGWLATLGEDVLSLANLLESPEVPPRFRRVSAEALESLLRASDLIPEGLESLGYLEQAFVFRLLARRAVGDAEPEAAGAALAAEELQPVAESAEPLEGDAEVAEGAALWAEQAEPLAEGTAVAEGLEGDAERSAQGAPPVAEPVEPTTEGAQPVAAEAEGAEAVAAEAEEDREADFAVPARVARLAAEAALVDEFVADDLYALEELAFIEARRGRPARQLLVDEDLRAEVLRDARSWAELYRERALELAEGPEELVKISSFFRTRLRRAS
jgi:hypothetical protein